MRPCIYELTLDSTWECPLECGLSENILCGGNGICDYDFSQQQPKCFCFDGKDGTACENLVRDFILHIFFVVFF